MVKGNTSSENGYAATGIYVWGITAYYGSSVISNTSYRNGLSATSAVTGIYLPGSSLANQNTSLNNNGTNMIFSGTCTLGINHAP